MMSSMTGIYRPLQLSQHRRPFVSGPTDVCRCPKLGSSFLSLPSEYVRSHHAKAPPLDQQVRPAPRDASTRSFRSQTRFFLLISTELIEILQNKLRDARAECAQKDGSIVGDIFSPGDPVQPLSTRFVRNSRYRASSSPPTLLVGHVEL
jgi:hypothetical protein